MSHPGPTEVYYPLQVKNDEALARLKAVSWELWTGAYDLECQTKGSRVGQRSQTIAEDRRSCLSQTVVKADFPRSDQSFLAGFVSERGGPNVS